MLNDSNFLRWLYRKRYQYEVTFSLYMLTPTEKFIFNSFLFLFLSMIIIAASLYLPEHITTMLSRAWFYYAGPDEIATAAAAVGGMGNAPVGAGAGLRQAATTAASSLGSGVGGGGDRGQRVIGVLDVL